jgi:hypothetical protein
VSRWFPERISLRLDDAGPGLGVDALRRPMVEQLLSAFKAVLDERGLAPRTRLSCVVADRITRYRIVPWNEQARRAEERKLFAEHCFQETYGEVARAWTVRVGESRYGQATLACALESALLDGVAAAASERGLVLAGLQPSLVDEFNRLRRHIDGRTFWFVASERGHLTILLHLEGQPVLVKGLAATHDDLGAVLEREWFARGVALPRCPVYLVGDDANALLADDWELRRPGGPNQRLGTMAAPPALVTP